MTSDLRLSNKVEVETVTDLVELEFEQFKEFRMASI